MAIKTNFSLPASSNQQKQSQRIAQDLSKNFKDIDLRLKKQEEASQSSPIVAEKKAIVFVLADTIRTPQSVIHNLGFIPKRWTIIDAQFGLAAGTYTGIALVRVSWNELNATFAGAGDPLDTGTVFFVIEIS
jgi:hypothetical protein